MFKAVIIGNLTADPVVRDAEFVDKETGEVKHSHVCDFTVAANNRVGTSKTTEFFRINVWRGYGDNCAKYLKKGSKVYIEGPISMNNYVDKNNNIRASMKIRGENVEFLGDGNRIKLTNDEPVEIDEDLPEDMPY